MTASLAEAGSLTLQWDPGIDSTITGYIVLYGSKPGTYSWNRNVGLVTQYQFTGLTDGAQYCFVVQSYNSAGQKSTSSNEACTVVGAPSSPPVIVSTSAGLQSALDAAQPGGTILLQAGVTFVGNFVLPAKTGTSYITIRSSTPDAELPAAGVRMSPSYAPKLAKLRSPNGSPALSTAPGAHHYRVQLVEFLANAGGAGEIIALGTDAQDSIAEAPTDLILDRLYVHGDATAGQVRGIALNSRTTTLTSSYIADIKAAGESQAIAAWNGPGPFVISNNYLEAAGQNVLIGAKAPTVPELAPGAVTLTKNLVSKNLTWRTQSWWVKSLLEVRKGNGVIVDGNVFENVWAAAGSGFAVLFYAANTSTSPAWSSVQDVRFTNNTVRKVSSGLYIAQDSTGPSVADGITVSNNLFDKVSAITYGGIGAFVGLYGGSDVTIDHNTVVSDGNYGLLAGTWPSLRLTFTNNILVNPRGAIAYSSPLKIEGLSAIAKFATDGSFRGGIYVGVNASLYPVSNFYPTTVAGIGFVNYTGGDYRLSSTSIYRASATDGKAIGCDITVLTAAQQ